MDNFCQACCTEFKTEASMHKHLKSHQLFVNEYYQKYYPRYDKYSKEIIHFKNKEQYFNTDFNLRENLKLWIQSTEKSLVKEYCQQILVSRKERKGIVWSPSQVELRTTMMPPIQTFNSLFGDYFNLCEKLGFKNRFSNTEIMVLPRDYMIYIDTREQKPLDFPARHSQIRTLKFGDYACSDEETTYIERKSPQDFVGTFSGGIDRFRREVDKAVQQRAYMVVLVEDLLSRVSIFNKLPYFFHKNVRINPEYVFHNVRNLIQDYPNLQFLFVNGRQEASRIVEKIFNSKLSYQKIDLQFAYDTRKL